MTPYDIIKQLGGRRRVADGLGVKRNTVHGWINRSSIPVEYWPRLVALSAGALTTDDLVAANTGELAA